MATKGGLTKAGRARAKRYGNAPKKKGGGKKKAAAKPDKFDLDKYMRKDAGKVGKRRAVAKSQSTANKAVMASAVKGLTRGDLKATGGRYDKPVKKTAAKKKGMSAADRKTRTRKVLLKRLADQPKVKKRIAAGKKAQAAAKKKKDDAPRRGRFSRMLGALGTGLGAVGGRGTFGVKAPKKKKKKKSKDARTFKTLRDFKKATAKKKKSARKKKAA